VHISAITLPEGVTPTITDRDFTIATIAGAASMKPEGEEAAAAAAAQPAEGEEAAPAAEPKAEATKPKAETGKPS
jgi:large subunit ribosomal protein L25